MKPFGILLIAAGGLLLFFGAIVGFETGFGNLRVMNLPMVIMGGVGILSGVILYAASSMVAGNFELTNVVMPPSESNIAYDRNKWNALVKYDDEIALIADKLKPLGQRWVDEFASSYLSLNDKSYLPNLVQKIIAAAKKEDEVFSLERQRNAAEDMAQRALDKSDSVKQVSMASLCVGVMCVFAIIAFFWFYGSEKILKADGSAIRSDSQPTDQSDGRPADQRQYELKASDLMHKLIAIKNRLSSSMPTDQLVALYDQGKLLIKQEAPQITTVSGWICVFSDVKMERGWVIATCSDRKMLYTLQFNSNEQKATYDKLINVKTGERIVFSGEVKENRFYVDINSNFVEFYATIDASK